MLLPEVFFVNLFTLEVYFREPFIKCFFIKHYK